MIDLSEQIELIRKYQSEVVEVLGRKYFVSKLVFEGKPEPTVILELWQTTKQVQYRLDWFVNNFKFVDI